MPARHLFAILIAFLSCVGLESGMGQVQAPETAVVSASVAGSIASGNLSPVTVILREARHRILWRISMVIQRSLPRMEVFTLAMLLRGNIAS